MTRGALAPIVALAKSDTAEALRRARRDPHPANRCQFLGWIARYAPQGEVAAIAAEGLAASATVEDPYWSVAIAAWPLRALIERDLEKEARRALAPVLARALAIMHPVCRMDALEILLHAIFPSAQARHALARALTDACRAASSWKAPRCLARAAAALASASPDEARAVLAAMADGRWKRRALAAVADGGDPPRPFFW